MPNGVSQSGIRRINADIAELYSGKTAKTVVRDVNALIEMGLVKRDGRMVVAKTEAIRAFLPVRRTVIELKAAA